MYGDGERGGVSVCKEHLEFKEKSMSLPDLPRMVTHSPFVHVARWSLAEGERNCLGAFERVYQHKLEVPTGHR